MNCKFCESEEVAINITDESEEFCACNECINKYTKLHSFYMTDKDLEKL